MPKNVRKIRGTALFDEFETLLPHFNDLDADGEYEFSKAINLLVRYFRIDEGRLEKNKWLELRDAVERMRQLHLEYMTKNVVIASAIFVAMSNVESFYLGDHDGKLIYKLTKAYIDRAKSARIFSARMAPSVYQPERADGLHS